MKPRNMKKLLQGLHVFAWPWTFITVGSASIAAVLQRHTTFIVLSLMGALGMYVIGWTSRKLVFFEPVANVLSEAKRLREEEGGK